MAIERLEVVWHGLKRMDLTRRPDTVRGDERVLPDIRARVDHAHFRSEQPGKDIRLDPLVCPKEIDVALNVLGKVTDHLATVK